MPRSKKDYKNLNIKLDRKISEQFENYCDELGQTKTNALERILQKHLSEFEKEEADRKLLSSSVPYKQETENSGMKTGNE